MTAPRFLLAVLLNGARIYVAPMTPIVFTLAAPLVL